MALLHLVLFLIQTNQAGLLILLMTKYYQLVRQQISPYWNCLVQRLPEATIGSIYFTNAGGQSDAHRQVAGIWTEKDMSYTYNTSLRGGSLHFMTKVSGGGNQNKMVFNNGGNLGIGTSSPYARLHLKHTTNDINLRLETDGISKGRGYCL